jgi:Trk K+ transport system NAD-binding subunit
VKSLALVLRWITAAQSRRNLRVVVRLLVLLAVMVFVYSLGFHWIMDREGQSYSWPTSVYWVLVTMSTLGFGDITFQSDLGRSFSVVVLLSGSAFILVLLPFTFIQFVFLPWMEARNQQRAPRQLPENEAGHVILTRSGAVEDALIRRLERDGTPYVLIEPDLTEALALHDRGYRVMVGGFDDPATYEAARVTQAALVVATRADTTNTNVTFTVREITASVPVLAFASSSASVDILELAGCDRVLQLGEMLGRSFAERVVLPDAASHVVGSFDGLFIAEAAAAGTPLVGSTLRKSGLREEAGINVVGVWDAGRFQIAGPDTPIWSRTVLVLAGTREQLDTSDARYPPAVATKDAPIVIIGGGRVGRSCGHTLAAAGFDYRIVEQFAERVRDPDKYVVGDAAELSVLKQAGIDAAPAVVITTHDDDTNVYLSLYCRKLRPDVQLLARARLDRNVSTLHRAGADVVLSYASTGATAVWNFLRADNTLLIAEGLEVFKVPVPSAMAGQPLRDCRIRQDTGCNVIAVVEGDTTRSNLDPAAPLPAGAELILIGDSEAEHRFLSRYRRS